MVEFGMTRAGDSVSDLEGADLLGSATRGLAPGAMQIWWLFGVILCGTSMN
jgi:hypothetical protein